MTYTQMKMLIEFIKLVVGEATNSSFTISDEIRKDRLEHTLLMSCGYERKF